MSEPTLRIVRGTPTPEELAVVTAVVAAASAAGDEDEDRADAPRRGRWNDPAACHRQLLRAGPGAWRAALR